MIVQTTATAFAWYSILHFAYPERAKWRDILAGYAVSVALNGILPGQHRHARVPDHGHRS